MTLWFFWTGIVSGIIILAMDLIGKGDTKRATAAFPFLMFLAAAVAKYIGL